MPPGRRHEILVERRGDEHDPFAPNAHDHAKRHQRDEPHFHPQARKPQGLRNEQCPPHSGPERPRPFAGKAVDRDRALIGIAAVERQQRVDQVGIGEEKAAQQQEDHQEVQVMAGDVGFEPIEPPHRDHQQQHHGEARQHRAEHEERRELGRMPAGRSAPPRKIEPDDAEWTDTTSGAISAARSAAGRAMHAATRVRRRRKPSAGSVEDQPAASPGPRGPASSRNPGPAPGSRTGSTRSRRSGSRRNPIAAGCGIAAIAPWCWG